MHTPNPRHHSLSALWQNRPERRKVGDTLTATVVDRNGEDVSDNVTFQWYADDEAIEGATDETLGVTVAMVGSTIKVVATAENGNTFESEETEEVGVYEALEILSAEQTGANEVLVTFSAPVTINDELAVFKGATEQVIADRAFADTTFTSVTLTMKNNFANGTYTVTLTPEDDDVDPSSVDFEATAATKAAYIDVKGDKFLMKNTDFDEGYCFIEGFNEFGEPINLTGLTVNVAPSDQGQVSFDSSTGKVTAKFANHGYAIVPLVTVFAQYTAADGQILTCQKTLEVVSIGYPAEIEFGDVKIDGKVDDTVTINDLATNKYYVELDVVKDQDGNDLSAEDLNDLVDGDLLTVIPQHGSPIFFGTNANPFSTVDGKVVVYLTPAQAGKEMPGLGQLMITGAGGTFTKEIQIWDNPYIDDITVDMPDLYQGEWSDEIAITAVDQYGDSIDLWDFLPDVNGKVTKTIRLTDKNNLTGIRTEISGENTGTWELKKDTVAKTYTLKYKPAGAAKQVATFTIISAGLDNNVITRTIGSRGAGAQIVAQSGAYALVENTTKTQNLNKLVSFKDANGKVMVRTDCYDTYPQFLINPAGIATSSAIKDDAITSWWWAVTENKIPETATAVQVAAAIGDYDADGEIGIGTNTGTALTAGAANATPSYYVTLLGLSGGVYKVLDSKAFRFAYAPAAGQTIYKKSVKAVDDTLYASEDGYTELEVTVLAQNESGEEWKPDQSKVTLTPDAPFTASGNKVSGNIGKNLGDGTVNVKVYYDGVAVDTIGIKYSDAAPVATKTEVKLETTTRMGKNWDATTSLTSFDESTTNQAKATFAGGKLTITNVNKFNDILTAVIKDQYGKEMGDSTLKLNGDPMVNGVVAENKIANFVVTNGAKKIDLEVTASALGINTVKPAVTRSETVSTLSGLRAAIDAGVNVITVNQNVDVDDAALNLTAGQKLIVPSGVTLKVTGQTVGLTGASSIVVNGSLITNDDVTLAGGSKITVNGNWDKTAGDVTGEGLDADADGKLDDVIDGSGHVNFTGDQTTGLYFNVTGSTLTLKTVVFSGVAQLGGHVRILNGVNFSSEAVELLDGLTVSMTSDASDLTGATNLTIEDGATITLIPAVGEEVVFEDANETDGADVTGVTLTTTGASGTGVETLSYPMAELTDLLSSYENGGKTYSVKNDLAITKVEWDTTDAANKNIVINYKAAGTIGWDSEVNTALGYGNTNVGYVVVIDGVNPTKTKTTSGEENVYEGQGATAAAAITSAKSAGTPKNDPSITSVDMTPFALAWATPVTGKEFKCIKYTIGGINYFHVYDFSACTFEAKPAEKGN